MPLGLRDIKARAGRTLDAHEQAVHTLQDDAEATMGVVRIAAILVGVAALAVLSRQIILILMGER